MKTFRIITFAIFTGFIFLGSQVWAQGIIDGFYSPQGDLSLTASYTGT